MPLGTAGADCLLLFRLDDFGLATAIRSPSVSSLVFATVALRGELRVSTS